MRKCFLYKVLSIWLAFVTLLFSFPGQTWAMFVPCSVHEPVEISGDLQSIQRTLEASLVRQRLMDIGLTSEEAMERIQSLSDEQIHEFATRLDALQAGAGIVDVLVIAILAVVITVGVLELTGHSVIIR